MRIPAIASWLTRIRRNFTQAGQEEARQRHQQVGPGAIWEVKRDFQFQFLTNCGLLPDHYLLDLGCGTLRGGIPLIRYLQKGHYFGLEIREEVIEEAQTELAQHGLQSREPTLTASDQLSTVRFETKFDFIWAFSVLFHMDDRGLEDAFALVAAHLNPGGVFYANVNIGPVDEKNWGNFPFVTRPLEFYNRHASEFGLSVADLGSLQELGHDLNSYRHLLKDADAHHSQRMLEFRWS